ncbi:hypothetical protein PA7_11070 [Pseudonocardia asaccharolytica DSM 44247 = NBRC 16224]|uniref:Uncharacterized protein n=1 Tax=Pseudonocardia asaccharolytica DSM 44247 = NBRC 16224 TaxID=1123024 RepID=A0A511CXH9_9PSEU|nr:hypothetical protein PA7_11070 [Pseudonocardia asaccharolytica DSM 44247 = NBRC 16224]
MSCNASKKTITSNAPGVVPVAAPTSKDTFGGFPASTALACAAVMEGSWKSTPTNVDAGQCRDISSVDTPWPQPTSATLTPASSRSTRPGTAGNQVVGSWCR